MGSKVRVYKPNECGEKLLKILATQLGDDGLADVLHVIVTNNLDANDLTELTTGEAAARGKCIICGVRNATEMHHLLSGVDRRAADQHRLKIPVCRKCHERIHISPRLMRASKMTGQCMFYLQGGTRMEWLDEFGQDYLQGLEP